MKRFRLFIENFVVYGLGGAISKIVPLVMLPIVTRLLTQSAYGLSDQVTLLVSFGSAIAMMGMYDAMFRLFFDKDDLKYKKEICSSALFFTLAASVVIALLIMLFGRPLSLLFFSAPDYKNLIAISALSVLLGSTNTIMCAPTRMNNQRIRYLVANTASPVICYALAIPLILRGWYVLALPLANLISVALIELFYGVCNRSWFRLRYVKKEHLKPLLQIGLPLMPNILIYWVFSASDKLMITHMLGLEATGVYAAAGKIGQISNLIYVAFAGGWQYFAFSTMKDDDQVQLTTNVFEYLGIISFIASMLMAAVNPWIFTILFTDEYMGGAVAAPYLFLAPLLLMLFQTACNQFLVIKKTWPNPIVLSIGALVNVGVNYLLIPHIGLEGAALGTLLGYVASVVIIGIVLQKIKLLAVGKNFLLSVAATLVYFVVWRFWLGSYPVLALLAALVVTALIAALYLPGIKASVEKMKKTEEKKE